MGDAARALDDVSDHLGEVLRRADDLLAEWSRFGVQVRGQVEREAAAIGEVVESAVGRVAAAGVDRAIADRLRALTGELERLEQRARAAARVAADQRDRDRRLLWAVIAGIVLANALLVVLVLRRPAAPPPAAEPVRLEATSVPAGAPEAAPEPTAADGAGGSAMAGGGAGSGLADGSAGVAAATAGAPAAAAPGKPGASTAAAQRGSAPAGESGGSAAGRSAEGSRPGARASEAGGGRGADAAAGGAGRSADGVRSSPIALPPKPAAGRAHKKLP